MRYLITMPLTFLSAILLALLALLTAFGLTTLLPLPGMGLIASVVAMVLTHYLIRLATRVGWWPEEAFDD